MITQKPVNYINLFVPGRICLFGEHSDWAGAYRTEDPQICPGQAVVAGIGQGIYASARPGRTFIVRSAVAGQEGAFSCPMEPARLREIAAGGRYYAYVAGTAAYMAERYGCEQGAEIEITAQTLPMRSGLASSASVCVLVARVFDELYGLGMSTEDVMEAAYRGEQMTPSQCGRMDQACAYGAGAVRMTFDGDRAQAQRITVGGIYRYVFADLCASKDTVRILADLNRAYPVADDERGRALHEALGRDNAQIVERAVRLLTEGDAPALGALMSEAQALFDEKVAPVSPQELASPRLHEVLADETVRRLTYGGKGVGSQGDGSVQLLARDGEAQQELMRYLDGAMGCRCFAMELRAADG